MFTVHLPKCLAKGFGQCPIPMLVGDISIFARWTSQLSQIHTSPAPSLLRKGLSYRNYINHYVVLRMPSYCDVHFRTYIAYRFPKWPYRNAPFPNKTKYKLLAIDPAILYHYEILWIMSRIFWAPSIAGKSSYPMRPPLQYVLCCSLTFISCFSRRKKNPIQKPWWKLSAMKPWWRTTVKKRWCFKRGIGLLLLALFLG